MSTAVPPGTCVTHGPFVGFSACPLCSTAAPGTTTPVASVAPPASPDLFTWLRGLPRDSRLHQVPMGEKKSLWEYALDALEQVGELRLWEPGRAGYAAVQRRVLDAEARFCEAAEKEGA